MSKASVLLFMALAGLALPARADPVDDFIGREMRSQHIPGLSMAIVQGGKLVKARGYGMASVELQAQASENTIYEIASLTKPFTAIAVLLLVEEGRVGLDDPIGKYVPGLPPAWQRVTVRQALSHTGGIPRDPFRIGPATEHLEYTRPDILRLVSGMPLLFEPAARFEYSNLSYYLLGALIEEVSGTSYGDWLGKRVFAPAGMRTTRINNYAELVPGRARGHEWRGEVIPAGYQSPSSYAPAGGILSTVVDLASWDAALSAGSLLTAQNRQLMWSRAEMSDGRTCSYGLGWNLDHVRGRRDVNHRGSNNGFASNLHRYEDDGLTVILLANLGTADLERVARGVAGHFVPELAPSWDMEPRPDPHPAWTDALREGLAQLALGRQHRPFSPEFVTEFVRQNRTAALSARLGDLRSFSFLSSLSVSKWRGNRPGGAVERLECYRLVSGSRTQGYVFEVDAAGRVLWLEVEEDLPRPSTMRGEADDAPELTREHERLSLSWAAGRKAATAGGANTGAVMAPGLREALSADVLRSIEEWLAGMSGLRFLASRDLRGEGINRLGLEVVRSRYYAVKKAGRPRYLVCHLGPDGELIDFDLTYQ